MDFTNPLSYGDWRQYANPQAAGIAPAGAPLAIPPPDNGNFGDFASGQFKKALSPVTNTFNRLGSVGSQIGQGNFTSAIKTAAGGQLPAESTADSLAPFEWSALP